MQCGSRIGNSVVTDFFLKSFLRRLACNIVCYQFKTAFVVSVTFCKLIIKTCIWSDLLNVKKLVFMFVNWLIVPAVSRVTFWIFIYSLKIVNLLLFKFQTWNCSQLKQKSDFLTQILLFSAVDVDDLLKRAHAELAMELDSELESIYTPGSQDMSIVSPFCGFSLLSTKMFTNPDFAAAYF